MSTPSLELREFSNGYEWVTSTGVSHSEAASEREKLMIIKLYDQKYKIDCLSKRVAFLEDDAKLKFRLLVVVTLVAIGLTVALMVLK